MRQVASQRHKTAKWNWNVVAGDNRRRRTRVVVDRIKYTTLELACNLFFLVMFSFSFETLYQIRIRYCAIFY